MFKGILSLYPLLLFQHSWFSFNYTQMSVQPSLKFFYWVSNFLWVTDICVCCEQLPLIYRWTSEQLLLKLPLYLVIFFHFMCQACVRKFAHNMRVSCNWCTTLGCLVKRCRDHNLFYLSTSGSLCEEKKIYLHLGGFACSSFQGEKRNCGQSSRLCNTMMSKFCTIFRL